MKKRKEKFDIKKFPKTIESKNQWVVLCDGACNDWLICGITPSNKEAIKLKAEIKDCPAVHTVRKCSVVVTLGV